MFATVAIVIACLPLLMANPTTTLRSDFKIVCYFINWAWDREGEGKYIPEDIDPSLCTHINYAFAILDENSFILNSSNYKGDIEQDMFRRVTNLKKKNPNLKVLLSLGGWVESAESKYSELVSSPEARQNFTNHVIPFLKNYNFDGLDVDWEYPTCWQGNCSAGPDSDKQNFAVWMKELREAFDKESQRLLLTAAVISGNRTIIDAGYDVPDIAESLDFINIMTYDMYGVYNVSTRHHAQMYEREGDKDPYYNVVGSMQLWKEYGCPAEKLVMGLPSYGRSFTLANPDDHGLGSPSVGPGEPGNITKSKGYISYYEICNLIKDENYTVVYDEKAGPYVYKGDQWIGYSDPQDAFRKAKWVRENGFGGVMVWETSMDDVHGRCCDVKYPYLKAMNSGLKGSGPSPQDSGCPSLSIY